MLLTLKAHWLWDPASSHIFNSYHISFAEHLESSTVPFQSSTLLGTTTAATHLLGCLWACTSWAWAYPLWQFFLLSIWTLIPFPLLPLYTFHYTSAIEHLHKQQQYQYNTLYYNTNTITQQSNTIPHQNNNCLSIKKMLSLSNWIFSLNK